jgi:hypothetical protein
MRHIHRVWRNPALPLLQFMPSVAVDQKPPETGPETVTGAGTETGLGVVLAPGMETWEAADHKHAFTITHERSEFAADERSEFEVSPDDERSEYFFVARVSWLDGSHRRKIGWKFKTFGGAVRLCSIYTGEARRQAAYHEAGHAVTAWLLGFSGVWIDMEDGPYRAITRHDFLPPLLAVADGGRAALARHLYKDLMFTVAGTVAEETIAGYRVGYVEVDVAGRTSVGWDAVRVARIEAGLPICGHKDCTIPLDASLTSAGVDSARVDSAEVAEVIKRAEAEVFTLLKSNWPIVRRVVQALCRRDRITSIEFEDLIRGPAGKRRSNHRGQRQRSKRKPAPTRLVGNGGPNVPEPSPSKPSMPEPMLIGDASSTTPP